MIALLTQKYNRLSQKGKSKAIFPKKFSQFCARTIKSFVAAELASRALEFEGLSWYDRGHLLGQIKELGVASYHPANTEKHTLEANCGWMEEESQTGAILNLSPAILHY